MDLTEKMNLRYEVTFSTSADAEAKEAGESVKTTTTIVYKDWTIQDFMEAAASKIVINRMQPRIRRGETIGAEYEAAKPGTKLGRIAKTPFQRLVDAIGLDNANKAVEKFGTVEKAVEALAAFIGG